VHPDLEMASTAGSPDSRLYSGRCSRISQLYLYCSPYAAEAAAFYSLWPAAPVGRHRVAGHPRHWPESCAGRVWGLTLYHLILVTLLTRKFYPLMSSYQLILENKFDSARTMPSSPAPRIKSAAVRTASLTVALEGSAAARRPRTTVHRGAETE
jgi:hypothetical protein